MKVCGIVGSPKKKGNVDLLVSQVLKGAESQGTHTQVVYLNDLSIHPCQSCGRCNCLMPYVKQSDNTYRFERRLQKKKKGVFIAVAGKNQEFDTILTTVKGFFCWANIELIEKILYAHEGRYCNQYYRVMTLKLMGK